MKKLFKSLMVIALISPSLSFTCDEHGLTGIMEENDLYIGPNEKGVSNVTYPDFKDVIGRITRLYEKDFEKRGLKLFDDVDSAGIFKLESNLDLVNCCHLSASSVR